MPDENSEDTLEKEGPLGVRDDAPENPESLAEKYVETEGGSIDKVRERWDGRPDLVIEDLFQVRLPDGTTEPLELFPYQQQFTHAYFYGDSSTVLSYKGRRTGYSFITMACFLIDAMRRPKTFYPVVSVKKGTAQNRIDDIYDLLDLCILDIPIERDNAGLIEFWNGSVIEAFSGKVDSDRGADPAKAVFIDEMAFLEDQENTLNVFRPFLALGEGNKMVQVSTPRVKNDKFMKNFREGSESGFVHEETKEPVPKDHPKAEQTGVIAFKQPSVKNAEDIDVEKPLLEQDVEPVRPDLSIDYLEDQRSEDPKGFAQEYLCRPISDEYRFFDADAISRAQSRGKDDKYQFGVTDHRPKGGRLIMSADIGLTDDDTVIAVFEQTGDTRRGKRYLRYWETVTNDNIAKSVRDPEPDRANPNHVANRISDVYKAMGCDHLVYDETGVGQGFKSILKSKIGRGAIPFNFTNKEDVKQMAHDLNYGLHNDNVTLQPSDDMRGQLEAVVKKKDEDYKTAKFTGKEHAPQGKDDIAMALILGAYPAPLAEDDKSDTLHQVDEYSDDNTDVDLGPGEHQGNLYTKSNEAHRKQRNKRTPNFGSTGVERSTSNNRSYQPRHP